MCKAFSLIIGKDKKVIWKWKVDSHEDLLKDSKYKDDTTDMSKVQFARVEIYPDNNNWIFPDKFSLHIDERIKPRWFDESYEKLCFEAFEKWKNKLYSILKPKKIINPFKDIIPPSKITKKERGLLIEWDSVRGSVRASVWASVWDSVRASVGDSVWGSVWDSVRASVWDSVRGSVWDSVRGSVGDSVWDSVRGSVWASVGAIIGSLFPRIKFRYNEKISVKGYPFKSLVKLWNMGLVPSFDGKVWRLHGGKDAKILYEISKDELVKFK